MKIDSTISLEWMILMNGLLVRIWSSIDEMQLNGKNVNLQPRGKIL